MTDNELVKRMRRIKAAIEDVTNLDPAVAPAVTLANESWSGFSQDFSGGRSQEHMEKDANSIITEFMGLRDRAKGWLSNKGLDKTEVVTFMKSNPAVALMHDLGNVDKHDKLEWNYSGHNPKLTSLRRVLQMRGSGQMFMTQGGKLNIQGNATLVLTGEVLDDHGAKLAEFDAIIDQALAAWEAFLSHHGLVLE